MTNLVPYLVVENPFANHSVHLLLINNNRFDTLISKDNSNTLSYSKIYEKVKRNSSQKQKKPVNK